MTNGPPKGPWGGGTRRCPGARASAGLWRGAVPRVTQSLGPCECLWVQHTGPRLASVGRTPPAYPHGLGKDKTNSWEDTIKYDFICTYSGVTGKIGEIAE